MSQQAIIPTMIIILAALQLTSNDVHSRLTRSKGAKILRHNALDPSAATDSTQLRTMQFVQNQDVASRQKETLLYTVSSNSYAESVADIGIRPT